MSEPTCDSADLVLAAAAFAARAHRHQTRKDGQTPYISHPFRVCLVVRHIFGYDDPRLLAAALLHDTLEDTSTDFDDLCEAFGPDVARWVAALSKDKRLPEAEREAAYARTLAAADGPVHILKLADLYDNLSDCRAMPEPARRRTARLARFYLQALRPALAPEAQPALQLVEQRLAEIERGLTT